MAKAKQTTWFSIAFLVLLWGLSWPIYKVGLQYTPPILFAGLRTLLGGLALAAIALPTYKQLQWRRTWKIYVLSSLLNVVLFFGLQTVGLSYLPAGLFSVLVYLEPVLVGLIAWKWLGERLTAVKAIGLVLGFLGVAAVSKAGLSGHTSALGVVIGIVTAVCWAIGTVYVKKVQDQVNLLWLVATQFVLGGAVMTIIGSGVERWSQIHWNGFFILTLLYGMVFGVALSWVIWIGMVHAGEVSRVTSYTFFVPLISVAVGTVFLHEPITVFLLIGLVLIVLSIYLVNRPSKTTGARTAVQPNAGQQPTHDNLA